MFPHVRFLRGYKHLLPVVSVINNKSQFDRVKGAFDTAIMGFFRDLDVWMFFAEVLE